MLLTCNRLMTLHLRHIHTYLTYGIHNVIFSLAVLTECSKITVIVVISFRMLTPLGSQTVEILRPHRRLASLARILKPIIYYEDVMFLHLESM